MTAQPISIQPATPPPAQITTLDDAIVQHQLYLRVCEELLSDHDYATIRGQRFRKRSGWSKLRRAFNVSCQVVDEQYFGHGSDWGYRFLVRATLPNGRSETSDGTVTYLEIETERINAALRRNKGQPLTGDELQAIRDSIRHQDVRGTALTRAKSRATSDILGAGIVSAEELEQIPQKSPRSAHQGATHWIDDETTRKRFWSWCNKPPALSSDQVHAALQVAHISLFPGTPHEACQILQEVKKVIRQDAIQPAGNTQTTHEDPFEGGNQ